MIAGAILDHLGSGRRFAPGCSHCKPQTANRRPQTANRKPPTIWLAWTASP